jgi:hypothetical protein
MFRMKREPKIMKRMKNKAWDGDLPYLGISLTTLASTASHITPIQPSVVITLKIVMKDEPTLSKF